MFLPLGFFPASNPTISWIYSNKLITIGSTLTLFMKDGMSYVLYLKEREIITTKYTEKKKKGKENKKKLKKD